MLQSNAQGLEVSLVFAATVPSAENQQSPGVLDVGQESRQVTRVTGCDRVREDHGTAETCDADRLGQRGRSETQGSFLNRSLHFFYIRHRWIR